MIFNQLCSKQVLTNLDTLVILNIVHYRMVYGMNTVVTSKEAILQVCREIVSEQGLSALNMRSLAEACHVSIGSLYNYFSGKDDLLIATIESVWQDIFHMDQLCRTDLPFPEYVRWIFESVEHSAQEYPNFFTAHSISIASTGRDKARNLMEHYLSHIKSGMAQVLNADNRVRTNAFSRTFTQSELIDFILTNILMLLVQKSANCDILIELIRYALYTDD